jgi:F420-non-reducing hydrogenase iron-sulfur subunit
MGSLMEHMGIEKDRVQFSWISSAEATKFVDVVKEISDKVRALGPNKKFVKNYNL